jgi:hypothetical protein
VSVCVWGGGGGGGVRGLGVCVCEKGLVACTSGVWQMLRCRANDEALWRGEMLLLLVRSC